ncbi:LysR family transcriptional regulator [Lentzea aerocolonigenes]|uniref:LysR family transcriptional regulator n=1 Tax=Lentzea aerocolonigenes TaxID=68170 RepID=UPI0004C4356D|nr:LysR substrate-binding domain-containing protein [Lentzea aerocolonigenes]MCP2243091.1 DNA-binding transcriptional regulator, LysR family [Lentzea aerocolonigenes]
MDLDLRKLRYFVAVAEHLGFGRAAEALHIAQPVLSRQIRALESELKVQLFDRSSKGTRLTPAGEQLLADARPLLAQASALLRRVGVADTFTVGFMPGLIITPAVRLLASRHPGLRVDVLRTTWDDQVEVIHDGRVDVSYVRLPVPAAGLHLLPVFTEPRVLVVPTTHRLAGKESVREADLAGERQVQHSTPPGFRSVEEKLEHVALHGGVAVLPLSTALFYSHKDLVHVPIEDIAPNEVALAWAEHRQTPLITEFAEVVSEIARQG